MKRFIVVVLLWMGAASEAAQRADDPVGFPRDYASFEKMRTTTVARDPKHGTVYFNPVAMSAPSAPYPHGSVIVMEWRTDAPTAPLVRLDVMRKERGLGESYGSDRTGEWAYASYAPDGTLLTGPPEALACARCHLKAGAEKDYVYHARPDRR